MAEGAIRPGRRAEPARASGPRSSPAPGADILARHLPFEQQRQLEQHRARRRRVAQPPARRDLGAARHDAVDRPVVVAQRARSRCAPRPAAGGTIGDRALKYASAASTSMMPVTLSLPSSSTVKPSPPDAMKLFTVTR